MQYTLENEVREDVFDWFADEYVREVSIAHSHGGQLLAVKDATLLMSFSYISSHCNLPELANSGFAKSALSLHLAADLTSF